MNIKFLLLVLFVFIPFTSAFAVNGATCRAQLEKALCYGSEVEHWAMAPGNLAKNLELYQERKCQPLPSKLKQTLFSIFDKFSPEIQNAFCHINKVFIISGDVSFGARADYFFDRTTVKSQQLGNGNRRFSGRPVGYVLELSEKNRFKGESASAYVTRVFQACFGNVTPGSASLPSAEYITPFGSDGALATTIVHELGHMLGRAHKVTSTYFLPLSEGNWSKISFKMEDGGYMLRYAPEGYSMQVSYKLLSDGDIGPTFEVLKKSGLATLYGGTSPQEDFAEFFMLMYYGNLKWNVKGKTVLDFSQEVKSNPGFKAKANMIKNLMGLPSPFSLKTRGLVSGEIGLM